MNIIKNQLVNRNNIDIENELKPNEAIIVCSQYIKEKLLKKGINFKEMYPGVFIVTSLRGNPTLQNIDNISRVIRLYNPDVIDEGSLVYQMSKEKIDAFFQKYHWHDIGKKKMNIKKVEYKGKEYHFPGYLIVTYQEGKKGREISFNFGDGWTELLGFTKDDVLIEDEWDKYLFNETVRPWLEKNKFNLSLEVYNNVSVFNNKNDTKIHRIIELDEK